MRIKRYNKTLSCTKAVMPNSDSGIAIDSRITLFLAGIGIKKIKLCWNRNQRVFPGIRIGIRNFKNAGIGIKMFPESCIIGT